MIKTLKHPLFKRELIQTRWATLLIIVAILFPIMVFINDAKSSYSVASTLNTMDFLSNFPSDILGWLTLPVLVMVQFYYIRNEKVYSMLAALPFDRSAHIKYKYFAGMLSITIAYAVSLLILSAAYFSPAAPLSGPYQLLVYWTILAMFNMYFLYSFLMLIASIMGNSILAGVTGFIAFNTPLFIVLSIAANIYQFTGIDINFDTLAESLIPYYVVHTQDWYTKASINFVDCLPFVLFFSAGSAALYMLARTAFIKNDFEYNGNLCMFVSMEKLFLFVFTLGFGLFGMDIAQLFEHGWLYPLALIVGICCFPIGYILAKRLLIVTGHQIKFKRI